MIGTLAIIGLGLQGTSIIHAARAYTNGDEILCEKIVGYDNNPETREIVQSMGWCDQVSDNLIDAIGSADLVILCTPLGTYHQILHEIAAHLPKQAIVSDVGSVKRTVVHAMRKELGTDIRWVAAHPVAGTEKSGPHAGFAELFQGRYCIVIDEPDVERAALQTISEFWHCLGAIIVKMSYEEHDSVLAITSHLPHLIAYTIVGTASDLEARAKNETHEFADASAMPIRTPDVIRYSAGGFRDFTRIAGSDPVMWRDVFLHNRNAVLEMLGRFQEDLIILQRAIRDGDGDKLQKWFTRTKDIRNQVLEMHQAGTFNPTEAPSEKE